MHLSTNSIACFEVTYPNKGYLYLVDSQRMRELGRYKYGMTTKLPTERKKGHQGAYEKDPSELLFWIEVQDTEIAENLARALFRTHDLHLEGNKEHIERNFELAVFILKEAARLHAPRTAKAIQKPSAKRIAANDPAWAAMLSMPMLIQDSTKSMGEWMGVAFSSTAVRNRLESLGVWCTNADKQAPEYTFDAIPAEWEQWLSSKGVTADKLLEADGILGFTGLFVQ